MRSARKVKPGTYQTITHLNGGRVGGLLLGTDRRQRKIRANNFITSAKKVMVTIRSSDEMFTSRNCGNWIRV
ncbi:hypothetical protein ONA91_34595 [Micromonospora sp. DR5-3]|uniref:hypothetical protein n=1 Tax=unclassified Micromonospora TaxID=2617518 RepID=UPI0011D8ACE5|nr:MULTISPECIES: hypothetical protein [unclassified Micromonospora]MCW3819581.1 hypothetical protein [Micromonospora sp. DR5-3]TYC19965.1 hypothetical protein FXF52_33820 [Micromonospora sp. MP36]